MRHCMQYPKESNHTMIKKLMELLQRVLNQSSSTGLEQFIIAHQPKSMFEIESLQRKYYDYYTHKGL